MKIEDIRKPEEKVLWQGAPADSASRKAVLHNGWLLPALITGSFCTMILLTMIVVHGVFDTLFSSFGLAYPLLMFPVWAYLYKIISGFQKFSNLRYCITDRGVYIQTGEAGEETTEMLRPERMQSVYTERSDEAIKNNVGDVICEYSLSDAAQDNSGDAVKFLIRSIPDYDRVSALISDLVTARREELEMDMQMRGPSAAEQFRAPTPLEYQPRYKYKRRAESLARIGSCANPETMYDDVPISAPDAAPEPPPAAFLEPVQQPVPAAVPQKDPAVLEGDPQAAFFGDARNLMPGKTDAFLDPDYASPSEILEMLPDESVADLQSELFGTDAEQQGAFPDPTVNPLPELSGQQKPQQGQYLQGV